MLKNQMEMFEDGGLKDEGNTIDPVSGNDVPPGSTQEEVRDDIPAQLSEGEFVFPADVVRYIGLEKLMMMRQEAKQGLKTMEDMGQMGNSEEATIPDDLPFDMTDLDIRKQMYKDQMEALEQDMLPFGIIDSGQEEESSLYIIFIYSAILANNAITLIISSSLFAYAFQHLWNKNTCLHPLFYPFDLYHAR